ncbi:hypothetical protein PENSPDRAFT_691388 [Peniophora sp. CONT]|nr:hypothetical protein PENSPDRAFT_691388 [Peniophora sp. CONT]
MPQISDRPPPYSHDWSSPPPPLVGDVDHRAWAFQLAFENAREIVRWTILQTFTVWGEDWAFKGKKISRGDLQRVYSQAPEDLKLAVDWQLKWDTPAIMQSDYLRRWHEHARQKDAGTYEEILLLDKFEREFDAASPAVQRAVQLTVGAWTRYNESVRVEPPQRDGLARVYTTANPSLKAALCFVLVMGLTCPIQRAENIDEWKTGWTEIVEQHRAQVPYWNMQGQAEGRW